MATLTLLAGTSGALTISCQRIGKAAYRYVGSKSYSFQGAERSSIRGQARIIPVLVSYVDTATEASIQAAIYNGAQIACSGDILGNIQTQCSVTVDKSDMIPGLPGFFEMALTVTEVQPSVTLLRYAPGDTVTGEAFTRSTTGDYHSGSATVGSAAINTKRDAHYIAGIRTTLLEDTRTNPILRSQEINNAAWTKTNATVTADAATAPDGTVTADLIFPATTGSFRGANQGVAVLATTQTASAYAKAAGFSWFYIAKPDGSAIGAWFNLTTGVIGTVAVGFSATITSLASGWYRCTLAGVTAAGTGFCQIGMSDADNTSTATTSGTNGVYVWGGQLELAANEASSYIPTTTVAVPRGADFYSLPFTIPPGELSVYLKFIEKGSVRIPGSRLFQISSAANATPQLLCYSASSHYAAYHHNGTASVQSDLAVAPTLDQSNEVLLRLFGDGSVDITQSINGGAATSGTQTAANTLPTAWSGLLLWLNSAGTAGNVGLNAFISFKIIAGCRSLSELRAA